MINYKDKIILGQNISVNGIPMRSAVEFIYMPVSEAENLLILVDLPHFEKFPPEMQMALIFRSYYFNKFIIRPDESQKPRSDLLKIMRAEYIRNIKQRLVSGLPGILEIIERAKEEGRAADIERLTQELFAQDLSKEGEAINHYLSDEARQRWFQRYILFETQPHYEEMVHRLTYLRNMLLRSEGLTIHDMQSRGLTIHDVVQRYVNRLPGRADYASGKIYLDRYQSLVPILGYNPANPAQQRADQIQRVHWELDPATI